MEETMLRKACGALLFFVLSTSVGFAQQQGGYLDVFVARVKPDKRADFDAVGRKITEANRRNNGDIWIALEVAYGETNTLVFSSSRESFGDVEKASAAFAGALGKAFGEAGAGVLFQQFNSTLESTRSEIRQRRWDLSYNPPTDRAAYAQVLGKTRWLRSVVVRVRPGHEPEFEAELKEINAAAQKNNMPGMRWVSQVAAGGSPGTYHITRLMTSLDELDHAPSMRAMLGDEGLEKFQKVNADAVAGVEYIFYRVVPELSNLPEAVTSVAPDFWNPKH
jgi:quinol monooxygenase YgiN